MRIVKDEKLGNLGEEPGRLSYPGYQDQENGPTPVPYGHVVREIRHMFGNLPDGDRGPKMDQNVPLDVGSAV